MKKGGPSHPKTLALAHALGVPRVYALGILEQLFHWAYEYCPRGDIGKWPNPVIAGAVEWTKDVDILINGLISSGWLDKCQNNRLIIHDWKDHAPTWLKGALGRKGETFAVLDLISSNLSIGATTSPTYGATIAGRVGKGKGKVRKDEVDVVVDKWNTFAEKTGLNVVKRMNSQRISKTKLRLSTEGFSFDEILDIIPKCPFLLGHKEDWKVSFNWLIANDENWVKVIEGSYISKDDQNNGRPSNEPKWFGNNTVLAGELRDIIISMKNDEEPSSLIKDTISEKMVALGADPDKEFESLMEYMEKQK